MVNFQLNIWSFFDQFSVEFNILEMQWNPSWSFGREESKNAKF